MWKVLAESVVGSGHTVRGEPCQDAHALSVIEFYRQSVLVIAAADGAGSASLAEIGARLACDGLMRVVGDDLARRSAINGIGPSDMEEWFVRVHATLVEESERRGCKLRDLACTAILAVVGDDSAAFAQLGDGAIVL